MILLMSMPSNIDGLQIFITIGFFILNIFYLNTLQAEFSARKKPIDDARPGYIIGLVLSIFNCFLFFPFFLYQALPALAILIVIGTLIAWIIYWVKISKYKNLLEGGQ